MGAGASAGGTLAGAGAGIDAAGVLLVSGNGAGLLCVYDFDEYTARCQALANALRPGSSAPPRMRVLAAEDVPPN